MSPPVRLGRNATKVLLITVSWTLLLVLFYVNSYLFIGDLVGLGKLSGTYEFWPDLAGNMVIGLSSGLLGGSLLVFKVNAGYRHRTFGSDIARSVAMFLAVYLSLAVVVVFAMPFVLYSFQSGLGEGLRRGARNVATNMAT